MPEVVRGQNPRGQDYHATTFATALLAADLGKAVTPSSNFNAVTGISVSAVTADQPVLGRLDVVEGDGFCSVQDSGYMELPFVSGVTPTRSQGVIGGATAGSVKSATAANGGRGIIVSVDETNLKVVVKLD